MGVHVAPQRGFSINSPLNLWPTLRRWRYMTKVDCLAGSTDDPVPLTSILVRATQLDIRTKQCAAYMECCLANQIPAHTVREIIE